MKLLSRILLVLLLSSSSPMIYAQIAPNALAFPSPNNNFLGAISSAPSSSDVGVDLYTGTALINIPICNLVSKELTIPISLTYTGAKGIKVQDYATSVGLGWALNAGGSISRVVRGWPDEHSNGYLGTNHWGQSVANFANNIAPLPSQISGGMGISPSADGEPDIFFIKTPYFSEQFVFDETGNPVFSNSSGLKVITSNFYNSYDYSNSSFTVIDDQGNQYIFGTTQRENVTANLYGGSYSIPTTWYLEQILSFNGKDRIIFSYISSSTTDVYKHYQSITTYRVNCTAKTDNTTTTTSIPSPRFIASITGSVGTVRFLYADDRRDVPNSKRLTTILLDNYPYGGTLQTYGLQYSYFGDPSSDAEALRLKLNKITLTGNTAGTATPLDYRVFTYNTTDNLPVHSSASFDYWGYYTAFTPLNGTSDPMQDPTLRQPNFAKTKANILTAIKAITGDSTVLTYEQNTYKSASGNKNVGGLRLRSILSILPTGSQTTRTFEYNDDSGNSNGQVLTESYNNLVYTYDPTSAYITQQVMSETPSNVYDINGNFVGYSSVKTKESNGGYTISSFNNFSDFQDVFTNLGGTAPNTIPNVISSSSRAFKRGMLKAQTVFTSTGKKVSQDSYVYTALNNPAVKKAFGFHFMYIGYSICQQSGWSIYSSLYNTFVENYRTTQIVHRDFDQLDDTRYVEKKVDYAYADNKRLVRSMSTTDSKGIPQTNTYYYPEDVTTPGIPMITAAEQTAMNSLNSKNRTGVVVHEKHTGNGATTEVHNMFTNYAMGLDPKVFQTSVDNYKNSVLTNRTNFTYDLGTSTTICTKDENGRSTSYLYGYTDTYPIAKVENASTTSSFTVSPAFRWGGTLYLTGTNQSGTFTSPISGDILLAWDEDETPQGNYQTQILYTLTGPVSPYGRLCKSYPEGQCGSYTESVTIPNAPAGTYKVQAYFNSTTADAHPLLDYYYTTTENTYATAKQFYYADFEAWKDVTSGGHTGLYSYTGSWTVNFSIPDSRSYKIQWWSYVSASNTWQFNEADYTGPTMTLSGRIDDVRVFPVDALMTTYTYSPLVGITSETDPTGKTTYYEYDGLQRPNIIRDTERKIIRKYCYNFSGQPNGCAVK